MLYRCLKPLWYITVKALKEAGNELTSIQKSLDETEYALTSPINFRECMEQGKEEAILTS